MNIEMDLVSDWKSIMSQRILDKGLQFSSGLREDAKIIKYFTFLRKLGGKTQGRQVYKSKEFSCPTVHLAGLNQLIETLKNGKDISPYLSKKVENISKIDGMFNDWGVLHLHLGDRLEKTGRYIERTGPLLFLYLMPESAFLINIYQHKEWTHKSILQTVYDNWPELIESYIIPDSTGVTHALTESQHLDAREAGSLVLMELTKSSGEKFAIMPPGLGITSSGDPIQDVRYFDTIINKLRTLEDFFRENLQEELVVELLGAMPNPVKLKLINQSGNNWIFEEVSTQKIIFEIPYE
ncbi:MULTISPECIES: hypothetical protein [unclassified Brevibacillus]|uniref:hypothetical protein n=1 Tax=unclassified Brevibacillus TaxID=2684853 RepID=UPI00156AA565|nr:MULTISPECIES: hypothetical protein [unclassified Brevibacillus]MDH6352161.1 hypothetical protein [Brevibacillus sp. 1238]NRQ54507.1 hypothetical protein [Brevibacillus sp. HD1.4A]UED67408.1 hypothetical protein HP435_19185 [Brevibacillus sp. HD3.3A]